MAIEQSIFDNMAGKRTRNYHHKMGGSRHTRISRWQRFLRAVKLAAKQVQRGQVPC